ncbi:hypothetical protein SDC9_183994 [bioreactor metagenome]|uniref:Uncharacterized protein n=1 Tax=bioreactor metagenome TaxID=1076179 RepID=A0A645HBT4_9ZZZZ
MLQAVSVGIDNANLTGIAMGNIHFVAGRVIDRSDRVWRGNAVNNFTAAQLDYQHVGGVGIGDKSDAFGRVQRDIQEVMLRLGGVNLHTRQNLRRFAIQGNQFAFASDGVNFIASFINGETDRIHPFEGV